MKLQLSGQQQAEAREWAAKLGVPEQVILDDAQAALEEGHHRAELARHQADQAIMADIQGAGRQMMPGAGPELGGPDAELEAG